MFRIKNSIELVVHKRPQRIFSPNMHNHFLMYRDVTFLDFTQAYSSFVAYVDVFYIVIIETLLVSV